MFSYELDHTYVREVVNKSQQGYEIKMLFNCTYFRTKTRLLHMKNEIYKFVRHIISNFSRSIFSLF